MEKKLTIVDIARLAGVSKATVSRVLNGKETVDPVLRERVQKVIEEYEFKPSINALGLNGRSLLLGILMPRYLWTALQKITWGIAGYVTMHTPYEIILYSCSNDEGYAKVIDQIIQTKLVAGLVATLYDHSPNYLEHLAEQGFPVVLVDTVGVKSTLPRIGVNNYEGAYQAVKHLLNLGHRRIGFIHGPDKFLCSQERFRAYRDALQEANIPFEPELFRQGEFEPKSGIQMGQELLSIKEPPTAVFASNDDMAYGTIFAAQERGLRVPEDVSVVGFNDDPTPFPRLTTVQQPFEEMGRRAAEMLIGMIANKQVLMGTSEENARVYYRELPTNLMVRSTTREVGVK